MGTSEEGTGIHAQNSTKAQSCRADAGRPLSTRENSQGDRGLVLKCSCVPLMEAWLNTGKTGKSSRGP